MRFFPITTLKISIYTENSRARQILYSKDLSSNHSFVNHRHSSHYHYPRHCVHSYIYLSFFPPFPNFTSINLSLNLVKTFISFNELQFQKTRFSQFWVTRLKLISLSSGISVFTQNNCTEIQFFHANVKIPTVNYERRDALSSQTVKDCKLIVLSSILKELYQL